MITTRQSVKMLLMLSVALIFNGCTNIQTPLNMDMPELYYEEGRCKELNGYEFGKCVAEQIEVLKTDRNVLLEITKGCLK